MRDLRKHNNREWFQDTKPRYDEAREVFRQFVQQLIGDVGKTEPAWAQLDARDCLFRIHRDLRFSQDKTPYKTNFSASLTARGKSVRDPGLYFALEPGGQSMIAGGMCQPTPGELAAIRAKIAADPPAFPALATAKPFLKFFPDAIWLASARV